MTELSSVLGFWTPGPLELVFILGVLVLLFGRKLPEIARNMGKSLTEFKKGIKESENDFKKAIDDADKEADRHVSSSDDFNPGNDTKQD